MAGHQRQVDQDNTDAHHVDHRGFAPSTSPDGDAQELRPAWKVPKIIVSPGVVFMSTWTPSIVPGGDDQSVYLVLDGFGKPGRSWPETDEEATELETVITNL